MVIVWIVQSKCLLYYNESHHTYRCQYGGITYVLPTFGGIDETRTHNQFVKSELLYH